MKNIAIGNRKPKYNIQKIIALKVPRIPRVGTFNIEEVPKAQQKHAINLLNSTKFLYKINFGTFQT